MNTHVIRRVTIALAAPVLFFSLCTTVLAQVASFVPGDFFVSLSNGKVEWRHADGTLVKTLDTGNSGQAKGMAFNASGNLYVTHWWTPSLLGGNDVEVFNGSGIYLGKFGSGFYCNPTSMDFDSAGNAYVGHADCDGYVLKFDAAGQLAGAFAVETEARGSAFIDLAADDCTLYYTSAGPNVKRFDVCSNTQLTDFNSVPLPAGSVTHTVRLLPNGGALVTATDAIVQYDAGGNVAAIIDALRENCWYALAVDPAAGIILAGDICTGNLYKFDLNTGATLQQFSVASDGVHIKGVAVVSAPLATPPPPGPPTPPPGPPAPPPGPEPPAPLPGPAECRMTGGGSVFFVFEGHDIRVTHGFQLRVPVTGQPQSLEVNWKDPNIPGPAEQQFHLDLLASAECAGNPLDTLIVTGIGLLNGIPGATIEAVLVDAGEPGKDTDTATFVIRDSSGTVVLVSSGTLERGNHQMH